MIKVYLSTAMLFLGLLFTSGCSTINSALDADNQKAAETVIKYATIKMIRNSSSIDSERVIQIAELGLDLADNPSTVVGEISDLVLRELGYDALLPEDKLIVDLIFSEVREALAERVERGDLEANAVLYVRTVLVWVREAAILAS